jgi:hypothetical protein
MSTPAEPTSPVPGTAPVTSPVTSLVTSNPAEAQTPVDVAAPVVAAPMSADVQSARVQSAVLQDLGPKTGVAVILPRQPTATDLRNMPLPRLTQLAQELGIDVEDHKTHPSLVAAIYDRRNLISSLDRESLLDILKWARLPIANNASKEQLAVESVGVKSMRFSGLSQRGLLALAKLRGCAGVTDQLTEKQLISKLKSQEGLLARLGRKRRALMGKVVARIIGANEPELSAPLPASPDAIADDLRPLHHEIEEQGLVQGLTNRVKRSADQYINQKLDEIEQRIDRKLDEIDRRLAEWRDKEIANRIRILKITLWVSVIVAGVSLLYSYVRVYLWNYFG